MKKSLFVFIVTAILMFGIVGAGFCGGASEEVEVEEQKSSPIQLNAMNALISIILMLQKRIEALYINREAILSINILIGMSESAEQKAGLERMLTKIPSDDGYQVVSKLGDKWDSSLHENGHKMLYRGFKDDLVKIFNLDVRQLSLEEKKLTTNI